LKGYFGVVLGCKGSGRKKKTFLGAERFFWFNLGARKKAAQARQAKTNQTQAKGSIWSQMASRESGRCWAQAVAFSFARRIGAPFPVSLAICLLLACLFFAFIYQSSTFGIFIPVKGE
jgi:hypothetical protein